MLWKWYQTVEDKIFCADFKIFHLCRLYGSYEALKGGNVADALTDFTGGICEGYTLRGVNSNVPRNIVNILFKALDRQSLIGCGINVSLDRLSLIGCGVNVSLNRIPLLT